MESLTFSGKPDLRRVELRDNRISKVKPAAIAVQQPSRAHRSGRTMTRTFEFGALLQPLINFLECHLDCF